MVAGGLAADRRRRARPAQAAFRRRPPAARANRRARVTIRDATTAQRDRHAARAGTAHIILAVEDDGSPTLTSYRRVILTIKAK